MEVLEIFYTTLILGNTRNDAVKQWIYNEFTIYMKLIFIDIII